MSLAYFCPSCGTRTVTACPHGETCVLCNPSGGVRVCGPEKGKKAEKAERAERDVKPEKADVERDAPPATLTEGNKPDAKPAKAGDN